MGGANFYMKHVARTWSVVLATVAIAGSARPAAAEEELAFTLDEVEAATAPKAEPEAKTPRKPKGAPIAEALGELRWGMSKDALLALMKKRIRIDYTARVKAEKDILRQDALYNEANDVFRRIKDGYVEFNGRKSGWDASAVAEEFTHGSAEAMLVVDDPSARDLYFFIHGRLWKWYRELKPASMGGGDFDSIGEMLQEKFGAAHERSEPRSEKGVAYRMLSWSDDQTRLSAIRRGGETCLVFEENATLERLAMLRQHAMPRDQNRGSLLEGVIMSTAEREAWRDRH
jgi:hypothetical protein